MIQLGFELTDTGKSFDKATLKKIFGDYVNIESKIHQDDDESGFGTILARQLIELMGGEFSADSPSGLDGDKGKKIVLQLLSIQTKNRKRIFILRNIVHSDRLKRW